MDYDKILVLKKGVVEEFGSPLELAITKKGTFSRMCHETGEYEELLSIGRRASALELE
jgi:ABC-type multidrug transport system fused ATPase/permease subunit